MLLKANPLKTQPLLRHSKIIRDVEIFYLTYLQCQWAQLLVGSSKKLPPSENYVGESFARGPRLVRGRS
jgi:hypothetical protein